MRGSMLKKDKPAELEKVKQMISGYSVVGMLNMHALPAKQLQKIRKALAGRAVIKMSNKNIVKKSFEGSEQLKKLDEYVKGEVALLLTNENPFKLYKYLSENKTPAQAKAGDIAPKDIIIQKGSTGIPPGPAISTLQKAGLKTTVQDGKIAVADDKVICRSGEKITADMVGAFSLLKMEPMEIGLDLVAVLESGVIYDKSVLAVDQKQYLNKLEKAIQQAINLSINADYPTPLTVKTMIQKSFLEAKAVAIAAAVLEKDIMGDLLYKALQEANLLGSTAGAVADVQ